MDIKSKFIESLFNYILQYSFVLPVLFFLIYYRKVKTVTVCKIVVIYSIVFFILTYAYDYIPKLIRKKYYYFVYTFIEYLALASIFWLIAKSKKFKLFIVVSSVLFILFQTIYSFTVRVKRLDTIPIGIETIIIFFFVFYFLFEKFKYVKDQFIYTDYTFWIVIGIMMYLGSSFFFNLLANHLEAEEAAKYWYLSYNSDILKNIFFAVGILVCSYHHKSEPEEKTKVPYLDYYTN